MDRQSVSSSNIASIWYDADLMVLEIEFNSWWIYQYADVPASEYKSLIGSWSIWWYFAANIRDSYVDTQIS